jgi:signal peptidase II
MSDPSHCATPSNLAPPRPHRSRLAVILVLLGCLGCDQATKRIAVTLLPEHGRVTLLGDSIRLEHVRNPGAFLSLGARLPDRVRVAVFTWGVGILVLAAVIAAFHRRASRRTALSAALVAGGGLGNLWDRVTANGLVTDFLNLGLGGLRTGIFNVADLAIVAGVLLLAVTPRSRARA